MKKYLGHLLFSLVFFIIISLIAAFVIALLRTAVRFNNLQLSKLANSLQQWYVWSFNWAIGLFGVGCIWMYVWDQEDSKMKKNKSTHQAKFLLKTEFNKNTTFAFRNKSNNPYQEGWVVNSMLHKKMPYFQTIQQKHALFVGNSGTGKTQTIIHPTIYNNLMSDTKPSMIISDPKGELFDTWRQFAKKQKYQVYLLDFEKFNGNFWNPFIETKKLWKSDFGLATLYLDDLINALTHNNTKEDFWDKSAKELLNGILYGLIIQQIKKSPEPNDYQNLVTFNDVSMVLSGGQKTVLQFFSFFETNDLVLNKVGAFLEKGKTLESIVMTCKSLISKINIPAFNTMCSQHEIMFEKIRIQPTIIFMKTSVSNKTFWFLSQLFLNCLFGHFLSSDKLQKLKDFRQVYFLLDEFANIPTIPNFDSIFSNARSFNCWFLLIVQSMSQLKKYPTWENIWSNAHVKGYLGCDDQLTLKMFSELAGNRLVENISRSKSKNPSSQKKLSTSDSLSYRIEPLISSDELRRLKLFEQVIFLPNQHPYKFKATPWYKIKQNADWIKN